MYDALQRELRTTQPAVSKFFVSTLKRFEMRQLPGKHMKRDDYITCGT